MKRYIDSNIFLNALLKEKKEKENAVKIIENIVSGKMEAFTSALTWDEITYVLKKFFGKEIAEKQGSKFLKMPNLELISTTKDIITKSQEIFVKYQINPRDAIHAASAMSINADIISEDSDFDKIKGIKRIHA